jgi:nucleoside-triphosphatase THEP1
LPQLLRTTTAPAVLQKPKCSTPRTEGKLLVEVGAFDDLLHHTLRKAALQQEADVFIVVLGR